jgi:hypothetical protein
MSACRTSGRFNWHLKQLAGAATCLLLLACAERHRPALPKCSRLLTLLLTWLLTLLLSLLPRLLHEASHGPGLKSPTAMALPAWLSKCWELIVKLWQTDPDALLGVRC